MKLIDLLCMINELSRYDSKNSIDYMYNDCDIVTIYHQQDAIVIMINL